VRARAQRARERAKEGRGLNRGGRYCMLSPRPWSPSSTNERGHQSRPCEAMRRGDAQGNRPEQLRSLHTLGQSWSMPTTAWPERTQLLPPPTAAATCASPHRPAHRALSQATGTPLPFIHSFLSHLHPHIATHRASSQLFPPRHCCWTLDEPHDLHATTFITAHHISHPQPPPPLPPLSPTPAPSTCAPRCHRRRPHRATPSLCRTRHLRAPMHANA
jgi:hypothetical protein